MFDDREYALTLLEDAEWDCNNSEDYINLADGLADAQGDPEQIDDLLQSAIDFAEYGEDFAEVAHAWLHHKNDPETALEYFSKAVSDRYVRQNVLQDIAKTAATILNNFELARQCYRKIANQTSSSSDLVNLAVESWEVLKNPDCTWALFYAAKAKMTNTNDLVVLAQSVVQTLNDRDIVRVIYRDAIAARSSSKDTILCQQMLTDAENSATSSADLESIIAAVYDLAPDDHVWLSRLKIKLEHSQTKQA